MKIFVSSTYLDLKEYRDKARKAIEENRNEFEGMETFQSHTHEPLEFCPGRVEECDALVLLVAYRYGNIPEGGEISITHLEYEHALRNKIPVRVYLTDDEHPWQPKFIDKNRESIDRFRTLLLKEHTCSFFTTPASLYEKLTLDIEKFPVPPYIAHPYALQANFTGREQERKMLTDWLTGDSHSMLPIIAIGGMGKTALAWYWLMEDIVGSDEQPRKIVWWSFYDYESGFGRFLKKTIEYFSDDEVDWDSLESTRDQMEFLYKLLCDNRFLLVFDGVERVLRAYYNWGSPYQGDDIKEDERGDFRACIEPNCGMFIQWLASGNLRTKTLLTSRLYPKELEDLDGCLRKDLKEMDKEDAVEFFHRQSVNGTRAEIEMACESVGYHPLSLRLLSGMIVHDQKNPKDIQEWMKYNLIPELKGKEGHNILELAYNSLDKKRQAFISKLSAFRNPMDYDAISIFNEFGSEEKFNEVLIELVDRGMLFRDEKSNKFDMHPIVRKYCYDRLKDKGSVHSELRNYFAAVPVSEKIKSVDDFAPVIELYWHTVGAKRYDAAFYLVRDRLHDILYYRFGAFNLQIELLQALFPNGEYKLPQLTKDTNKAWVMVALANSYQFSSQPQHARGLFEMSCRIDKKLGDKKTLAIDLGNVADYLLQIGELCAAEKNWQRSIQLSSEIGDELTEAIAYQGLGLLFAIYGRFAESKDNMGISLSKLQSLSDSVRLHNSRIGQEKWTPSQRARYIAQRIGRGQAYEARYRLLAGDAKISMDLANKAHAAAHKWHNEREIIRAGHLLGATHLMEGNLIEAEKHLTEALTRDRKINLVELEPDILLEFAKLRFKENHKEEALKFADEAL